MASPVYHREDLLPRKTGLTFSDSLLVKPRDQDQVESFKEYFKGLEKDVTVTSKVEGTDLYRLRIKDPKHENALDIAEHLAQSPLIEYVGQDWLQLTSAISTTTPPNDDLGHGTCCAGISAAQSNNNLGFVGVAWNCKIMSIRMLE